MDVFPASIAQERIWLVHSIRPWLPVYNVGMSLPVPDAGSGTLTAALARIVARHESLRTSFVTDGDGALLQVVHPAGPVEIAETDLRPIAPADREAALRRAARPDAETPFDLARPPLWRARLVRLADDDARLVFVCHHAVFDGASADIFGRELLRTHAALAAGHEPGLPDLPIQYADYAVWQREQPTPETVRAAQDLDLPTDRPRPATPSQAGAVHTFTVADDTAAKVVTWSRTVGVTPFMTMLAAFGTLLGRWAGRDEVHVGCPVGGRTLPELTGLIGMFVHTAVVPVGLAGDPSFAEVTRRARDGVLAALEQQEAPGRAPHYRVSFNLVPSDTRGQLDTGTVMTDLALDLSLGEDGRLRGRLEYATDLFDERTVREVADAYLTLLAAALDTPDRPVSALPAPLPARGARAVEWIDGGPLPKPARPVVALIADQDRSRPALFCDGRTVTYGELHDAARARAGRLTAAGAGPGRPVGVALTHGVEAVVTILAALRIGAPYVAVDPGGPLERARAVFDDARPAVVVSSDGIAPAPGGAVAGPAAYITYTSGSTGRPKGVVVGAAALAHFVAGATDRYGITADDRVLQFAPLHFDASVEELFVTLCAGATLVTRTPDMLESPQRLLAGCADLGVTVLDLPTAYWHELAYLVGSGAATLPPGIRTVIIGGEAASPARVAQWLAVVPPTVRLINSYGPTEATVVATTADLTDAAAPIGRPLPGVRAAIVDGELYLAGGGLADGYHRDPEATADRFVTLDGRRAYRTGDLVRRRDDGHLEFVGRADDEVKISGHRVDPAEIESVLLAHPAVRDAAVVADPSRTGTPRLVAYVVGETTGLRDRVAATVPAALVPSAFVAVPEIPRTPNNKVDRAALRHGSGHGARADASGAESVVLDVFESVLGTRPASVDDDLFDLGGHSLQTIQIATRLTAELGREVTVGTVFLHPTAAGLAAALDGTAPATTDRADEDAELPEDIRPSGGPARTAIRTVLVTGATGFVGRYLVRELLTATDVRVVCPVRGNTDRLRDVLRAVGVDDADDRVRGVTSDLSLPRFGLSPADFAALADECDAVYHVAAQVSLALGYDSSRASNVVGTREVLRLAATGRPSAVHHVSTIAVAAAGPGYVRSKQIAEELVGEAGRRGLPVTIYRLGRVAGPGDGSAVNPDDLVWRVLRAGIDLATLPDLRIAEPWTPVDWVARTLVAWSQDADATLVRALLPARPTGLPEVFDWAAGYGYDLPRVPPDTWAEVARRHPEHAAVAVLFAATGPEYRAHPGQPGSDCPPVGRDLMRRYLATAVRAGVLPPPQ